MKDIQIQIQEDGTLVSPYTDDLLPFLNDLDGKIEDVQRLTQVEMELGSWTVRANFDPEFAIRVAPNLFYVGRSGVLAIFKTRETALEAEMTFFWEFYSELQRLKEQRKVQTK